jgi:hypothetical protein
MDPTGLEPLPTFGGNMGATSPTENDRKLAAQRMTKSP